MIVERFSHNVIGSGIFKLYIAIGFFATVIFFVLNTHVFTPLEMTFGIIVVTIILKAISNIMLSLIILLFNLDNKKSELDFQYNSEKIDELLGELAVNESKNQ